MPARLHRTLQQLQTLGRFFDKRDWRVLQLVLGMKLVLLGFGAATIQAASNQAIGHAANLFSIWNHWDAPHYLFLAEYGYPSLGQERVLLVFFPLLPWLVRVLAPLSGGYLAAALCVSTVCSLVLALLLRRLVALDSEDLSETTVVFMFAFPTAYFLHIGYTESLFLALTLGAFLAARRQCWPLAGVLGAFAALARVNAVILVPALLLEAWSEYRRDRRWRPRWLCAGLPLVGVAVYMLLNVVVGGHPFRFLDYQAQHWGRHFAWPWDGMRGCWIWMRDGAPTEAHMVGFEELLFVLIGLAGTVVSWFRLRKSYAVWMTGNWLLFSCQSFVQSVPRYTLLLFPLFLLFAQMARNRVLGALLVLWSLLFFALFASQFVQGRWAF